MYYFESITGNCIIVVPAGRSDVIYHTYLRQRNGSVTKAGREVGKWSSKHVSSHPGWPAERDRGWEPPCRLIQRFIFLQQVGWSVKTNTGKRALCSFKRRWRSFLPSCRCGMEEDDSTSPSSLGPGPVLSQRASCHRAWPGPRSARTEAPPASPPLWGRNT